MSDDLTPTISVQEISIQELFNEISDVTVVYNDPPWEALSQVLPTPTQVISAWNMDIKHLEEIASTTHPTSTVVGVGGGTALDTAKFLAWKHGSTLIKCLQLPVLTLALPMQSACESMATFNTLEKSCRRWLFLISLLFAAHPNI